METIGRELAADVFSTIVGRVPDDGDLDPLLAYASEAGLSVPQLVAVLRARGEVVQSELERAQDLHLFALHHARVAMMASLLPPADRILDLGGANSPLYESGYAHPFLELTMVDLPPADRHEAFANRIQVATTTESGSVRILYSSMTDLSAIPDGTIDLVWSGQSIEHITRDEAHTVYGEVKRVLAPQGVFCLDTPNALVTRIHSPDALIHPDHKIEYTPEMLMGDLRSAGFTVTRSFGICEMPLTLAAGRIDYRDFLLGAGISSHLETCYVQFHECRLASSGGDTHGPDRKAPWAALRARFLPS